MSLSPQVALACLNLVNNLNIIEILKQSSNFYLLNQRAASREPRLPILCAVESGLKNPSHHPIRKQLERRSTAHEEGSSH
jgi:hypothetical protein